MEWEKLRPNNRRRDRRRNTHAEVSAKVRGAMLPRWVLAAVWAMVLFWAVCFAGIGMDIVGEMA